MRDVNAMMQGAAEQVFHTLDSDSWALSLGFSFCTLAFAGGLLFLFLLWHYFI